MSTATRVRRTLIWPAALALTVLAIAACARSDPTPAPTPPATLPPTSAPAPADRVRAITFVAADGAMLTGRLYGAGSTAVILSNMGDNDPAAWDRFAPALASRGYTVLTYTYRYPTRTSTFTAAMAHGAVRDLAGAAEFVRRQGARRVVLIGASLGGMATAKAGAVVRADALVIIAAPVDLREFQFRVEPGELAASTAPKLFVASDDDRTVDAASTRRLFDLAREPKEWQSYPSTAHGTQLLDTPHGEALRARLIAFVAGSIPA